MLWIAASIKLMAEVALLALVGQGALALLAGEHRHRNFAWQLITAVTRPVERLARWLTPRSVPAAAMPWVGGIIAAGIWLAATVTKIGLCVQAGMASRLCH